MPTDRIMIGKVEITALTDGVMNNDPCDIFPEVAKERWEHYPGAVNDNHKLSFNLGSYLVRSNGRTILIDTGLGPKPQDDPDSLHGELIQDLEAKGLRPENIDIVVITHLHPDHVGWNLSIDGNSYRPTFPEARYWIGAKDWEYFITKENLEARPYNQTCVKPLEDLGVMDLMEEGQAITDELTAILTPGHTPGHMSIIISSEGEKGLVLGDVAHHPVQVHELEWSPRFDHDPAQAVKTRSSLMDRMEQEGFVVVAGHFPSPGFGRLARMEGRRCWQVISAT